MGRILLILSVTEIGFSGLGVLIAVLTGHTAIEGLAYGFALGFVGCVVALIWAVHRILGVI